MINSQRATFFVFLLAMLPTTGCVTKPSLIKHDGFGEKITHIEKKTKIESVYGKAIETAISQFKLRTSNYGCFDIWLKREELNTVRVSFLNAPPGFDDRGNIVVSTKGKGPCGVGMTFVLDQEGNLLREIQHR